MALSDEWKDKICEKLIQLFENDPDTLTSVLWSLNQKDNEPKWKPLKVLFNLDDSFELFAKRIAEEDANMQHDKNQQYEYCYEDTNGPELNDSERYAVRTHQGFDLARINKLGLAEVSGTMGFARACTKVSAINVVASVDEVVSFLGRNGNVVMVGLAAVYLSVDTLINIRKYWIGEISGKRAWKNIIDTTFTMVGSAAGGMGFALLGSFAGPFGTLVGGILGGIISAQAMAVFSDGLTQKLFGVPKTVALENAYNYFGVKMTADAAEINTAYRRMCIQHHPDKGGSKEEFLTVQLNMSIIKVARGCL